MPNFQVLPNNKTKLCERNEVICPVITWKQIKNHLPLLEEMFRFRALEYKCFQVTLMQIDLQRLSFFSPQEDEYYKEN